MKTIALRCLVGVWTYDSRGMPLATITVIITRRLSTPINPSGDPSRLILTSDRSGSAIFE